MALRCLISISETSYASAFHNFSHRCGAQHSGNFRAGNNQPTVDELVAKNIEAKGGAPALNNLQTLRATGKLLVQVQGQIELGYVQIKKRPDEVRTEASLQGMTQIEGYDGKEGWKVSPFFGRKDPERYSKPMMSKRWWKTPRSMAHWPIGKQEGSTVEYLGTEDVDGTPAHKLKVVRKNGDVSFVYLDPDHFLEIRIVTQRVRRFRRRRSRDGSRRL